MKRLFFIMLLMATTGVSQLRAQVDDFIFFEGQYEHLQLRAKSANKPYFVYLYANWAMSAKQLNETTFKSSVFSSYANEYFLGVKYDGEAIISDGASLAQKHAVLYLPVIMIFTPEGKEMERIYGYISGQKLRDKLEKYANAHGEPEVDEMLAVDEISVSPSSREGQHLFKFNVERLNQVGYGVQVGAFSNYRNAFVRLLELKEKYYHRNVLVFIDESNAANVQYKLILGPFYTEEQAEKYLDLIQKKEDLKGVVVDLEEVAEAELEE
jgi:hypothetical protein